MVNSRLHSAATTAPITETLVASADQNCIPNINHMKTEELKEKYQTELKWASYYFIGSILLSFLYTFIPESSDL